MKRTISYLLLFLIMAAGLLVTLATPTSASPQPQVAYQTPTALPDGRVIYKVQPGDSCLRIELLTGVKVEQLRSLNKLDAGCSIQPNQELLLTVLIVPPTATPNTGMTATPLLPTPSPKVGTGEICVTLFADINGDAVRGDTESPILGGAVSVTDRSGSVSKTGITTNTDTPLCFTEIPEGDYNISMAVPDGYNPTTTTNYPLKLIAGNRSIVDFGAQISTRPAANPSPAAQSGRSPLLLVLGGVLILAGIAFAVYFRVIRR
jgi:LysM repeat protein